MAGSQGTLSGVFLSSCLEVLVLTVKESLPILYEFVSDLFTLINSPEFLTASQLQLA
jgi:hypothetical protein